MHTLRDSCKFLFLISVLAFPNMNRSSSSLVSGSCRNAPAKWHRHLRAGQWSPFTVQIRSASQIAPVQPVLPGVLPCSCANRLPLWMPWLYPQLVFFDVGCSVRLAMAVVLEGLQSLLGRSGVALSYPSEPACWRWRLTDPLRCMWNQDFAHCLYTDTHKHHTQRMYPAYR